MDTASNLGFTVSFTINPNIDSVKVLPIETWSINATEDEAEDSSAQIEENDELNLFFNSDDPNARLYFDALECCPQNDRIKVDEMGLVYCTPSHEELPIYRSTNEYDALRVDTLRMTVVHNGIMFSSLIGVVPKQLSKDEWEIMRDDLECEIRGLAQDVVRKNMGLGDEIKGILPPDDLLSFMIINRNSNSIISALIDIKDSPKHKIEKVYIEESNTKNHDTDEKTIKRHLQRGASTHKTVVPHRIVNYDIQENRLLKQIIKTYDQKLEKFIEILKSSIQYRKQQIAKRHVETLNDKKYNEGLSDYLSMALKLKKTTGIIKQADWFQSVQTAAAPYVPHSFAIDSRYGSLYRLYMEMKKKEFDVKLDPLYSYSWKKSSSLYEMWCYISLCRYLVDAFGQNGRTSIERLFVENQLFPFLKSGSQFAIEGDTASVEVVFDTILPKKKERIKMHHNPLYITCLTGNHFRPDICINVYSKQSGWYVGSYIYECKYRKMRSFYSGTSWSSKEQIVTYQNDSASQLFYNGTVDFSRPRPVKEVIVLTPDTDLISTNPLDAVSIKTYRPTADRRFIEEVGKLLVSSINSTVKEADDFFIKTTVSQS